MEKLTYLPVVVLAIVAFLHRKEILSFLRSEDTQAQYKRKDYLLNISERQFFESLQKIIPADYVAYPQILLSNIIAPNISGKEYQILRNKIKQKTIDFVIFELPYLKPVLAIEYDGKTHKRSDRQERDKFVNESLEGAGISMIHIPHSSNIDFSALKEKISEVVTNKKNPATSNF